MSKIDTSRMFSRIDEIHALMEQDTEYLEYTLGCTIDLSLTKIHFRVSKIIPDIVGGVVVRYHATTGRDITTEDQLKVATDISAIIIGGGSEFYVVAFYYYEKFIRDLMDGELSNQ